METEQISAQEIVVPQNRKKQLLTLGMAFLLLLLICATFILIAFILHQIIFGILALIVLLETIGIIWFQRRALRLFFSDVPLLRINQQGITFIDMYQHSFKITLLPWSAIEKLSCFHSQRLLFTITLKDPQYWWSCSGNELPRKFPSSRQFGGAQFAFTQNFISTSLLELLQQIQVNYAHEIQINEIEIVPFASSFPSHPV